MNERKKNTIIYVIIFLITLLLTLIGLQSSPFYNGITHNDSSVFQIIGNGLLKNKIPYKDLFDHKGPIVYVINALALLINKNIGLYILELILLYIGTIYMYKTSKLMLKPILSLSVCCIYEMLIFIVIIGGNFTEEYEIIFSSIALFYMMKILYQGDIKSKKNWIFIGVTFAINFLIKPSYISIWIAFGIATLIYLIKNRKINELVIGVLYIILGIVIIFIPIIIYMISKNCVNDFLYAYFTLNMKYSKSTMIERFDAFKRLIMYRGYFYFFILTLMNNIIILFTKKVDNKLKIFATLFFLITLLLASYAANVYIHYLIQYALCMSLEVIIVMSILDIKDNIIPFLIILCTVLYASYMTATYNGICSLDAKMGNYIKECLDQIKTNIDEDDAILVLGNQPYYYIYLEKEPNFKYFFQTPIVLYNRDIEYETQNYIIDKKPKVIILECDNIMEKYFKVETKNIIENNYQKYNDKILKYYVLKEN